MTGTWLRRREDEPQPHRCDPPSTDAGDFLWPDGQVGDIWQCRCGRRWIVRPCASSPCSRWVRRRLPWPRRVEIGPEHPTPNFASATRVGGSPPPDARSDMMLDGPLAAGRRDVPMPTEVRPR